MIQWNPNTTPPKKTHSLPEWKSKLGQPFPARKTAQWTPEVKSPTFLDPQTPPRYRSAPRVRASWKATARNPALRWAPCSRAIRSVAVLSDNKSYPDTDYNSDWSACGRVVWSAHAGRTWQSRMPFADRPSQSTADMSYRRHPMASQATLIHRRRSPQKRTNESYEEHKWDRDISTVNNVSNLKIAIIRPGRKVSPQIASGAEIMLDWRGSEGVSVDLEPSGIGEMLCGRWTTTGFIFFGEIFSRGCLSMLTGTIKARHCENWIVMRRKVDE